MIAQSIISLEILKAGAVSDKESKEKVLEQLFLKLSHEIYGSTEEYLRENTPTSIVTEDYEIEIKFTRKRRLVLVPGGD